LEGFVAGQRARADALELVDTSDDSVNLARTLGGLCRELRGMLADDGAAQAVVWRLMLSDAASSPREDRGIVSQMSVAVGCVDRRSWADDDWATFYESFMAAYAPRERHHFGVYITPTRVVEAQVRLIGDVLARELDPPRSFASSDVVIVDPAAGTGAYPLAVIAQSHGASWAGRMHLFEPHPGAASVAAWRLRTELGSDAAQVHVRDVLDRPTPAEGGVVVCLGNPPYDRQVIAEDGSARKGGWVRFGDPASAAAPLLHDLMDDDNGLHHKNLFNDYVYFWRWAVWAVCEQRRGPGIVSFLTPASYLRGPGFGGLRALLRKAFDVVWIVDLEGDRLAARKTDNVFSIRTPVAIAIAARFGPEQAAEPARVRYARLDGSRSDKLAALGRIRGLSDLTWHEVDDALLPTAVFLPRRRGAYSTWPRLSELFPWQASGCQMKRTWPIAPTPDVLRARWAQLLDLGREERAAAFRPTRDRSVDSSPGGLAPIASLTSGTQAPRLERYVYRSFDRQWLIADPRFGDFMRPLLWRAAGPRQVFMTSLLTNVLGPGPASVVAAHVPDLDHFRGSFGGRAVIPLWCDTEATRPNSAAGLLDRLASAYGAFVQPEAFFAYCYALLSSPTYVDRFAEDLRVPGPRIPLTADLALFERAVALGRRLVGAHTFGERFEPGITTGQARCVVEPTGAPRVFAFDASAAVLQVGEGRFEDVAPAVWEFSVSGLRVVRSWLGYRSARPRRRATSPLDQIRAQWSPALTCELLEVIWVLEATIAARPELAALLDDVVRGPTLAL